VHRNKKGKECGSTYGFLAMKRANLLRLLGQWSTTTEPVPGRGLSIATGARKHQLFTGGNTTHFLGM